MSTVPKTKTAAARAAILARRQERYAERLSQLRQHIGWIREVVDHPLPRHSLGFVEACSGEVAKCEAILADMERHCGLRA